MFYIVFRSDRSICPAGIRGGFDRNKIFDDSLFIECLDQQVPLDCCSFVDVEANGIIAHKQSILDTFDGFDSFDIFDTFTIFNIFDNFNIFDTFTIFDTCLT